MSGRCFSEEKVGSNGDFPKKLIALCKEQWWQHQSQHGTALCQARGVVESTRVPAHRTRHTTDEFVRSQQLPVPGSQDEGRA